MHTKFEAKPSQPIRNPSSSIQLVFVVFEIEGQQANAKAQEAVDYMFSSIIVHRNVSV